MAPVGGPARATGICAVPAFSATEKVAPPMAVPLSSLSIVTVATLFTPSWPPAVGEESVIVKVSGPSITASFTMPKYGAGPATVDGPNVTSLLVSPAAKVTVVVAPVQSEVIAAVPAVGVSTTDCASAVEPVRVMASVTFGPPSATLIAGAANSIVLSLSVMLIVVVGCGPSEAPPVGLDSVIVKFSVPSKAVSSMIGTS